jgi:hypothetical protein
VQGDLILGQRERLAGGDAQLQLDEVEAGDALGDRVLDLQAGVHLEEVELAAGVEHELDGAGADVVDRPGGGDGGGAHAGAQLRGRRRARATPRRPSGGGAGPSSRARRGG